MFRVGDVVWYQLPSDTYPVDGRLKIFYSDNPFPVISVYINKAMHRHSGSYAKVVGTSGIHRYFLELYRDKNLQHKIDIGVFCYEITWIYPIHASNFKLLNLLKEEGIHNGTS